MFYNKNRNYLIDYQLIFKKMPLKSKAQMRYLFWKDPALAKEFAEKTANIKALPEHVKKKPKVKK